MPATTLFGCKLRQLSTDCTLFYFMVALVQVIFLCAFAHCCDLAPAACFRPTILFAIACLCSHLLDRHSCFRAAADVQARHAVGTAAMGGDVHSARALLDASCHHLRRLSGHIQRYLALQSHFSSPASPVPLAACGLWHSPLPTCPCVTCRYAVGALQAALGHDPHLLVPRLRSNQYWAAGMGRLGGGGWRRDLLEQRQQVHASHDCFWGDRGAGGTNVSDEAWGGWEMAGSGNSLNPHPAPCASFRHYPELLKACPLDACPLLTACLPAAWGCWSRGTS